MRKIKYFNEELTIEEYVKKEICKNAGTQSIAFKEQLTAICDSLGITYDKTLSKDNVFDLLIDNGCDYKYLAEQFGVGVSSLLYQETFDISHQDVKRLEKFGILKKVGVCRFRAYGKYHWAPLYDVYQYASMEYEEMQELLHKYPKGKRIRNV